MVIPEPVSGTLREISYVGGGYLVKNEASKMIGFPRSAPSSCLEMFRPGVI